MTMHFRGLPAQLLSEPWSYMLALHSHLLIFDKFIACWTGGVSVTIDVL